MTAEVVPLREVLRHAVDAVPVDSAASYPIAGVYSFGRGLLARQPLLGSQTTYKVFHRLHTDDFVISQLKAWEGAIARVNDRFDGWFLSPQFHTFRVVADRLDIAYLNWYFRQPTTWEALRRLARGMGARRDSVSAERFLALSVPLPPLDEQRRIVARIEQLAAKIEEARGLRRQAAADAGAIASAERSRVFAQAAASGTVAAAQLATFERGKFSHRPRNDTRFFGGDHPWIQIAEVQGSAKYIRHYTQTLNDEGLAVSRKFPKGTVLVSIAATIGAVGILGFDCCVPDSIVAVTPGADADAEFIYHWVGYVRTDLERMAPQSAQKNVNLKILSSIPIPNRPLPEQRRIVAYLDGLQARVDALKRLQVETAAELDALLPSVLDKAFKGEL